MNERNNIRFIYRIYHMKMFTKKYTELIVEKLRLSTTVAHKCFIIILTMLSVEETDTQHRDHYPTFNDRCEWVILSPMIESRETRHTV